MHIRPRMQMPAARRNIAVIAASNKIQSTVLTLQCLEDVYTACLYEIDSATKSQFSCVVELRDGVRPRVAAVSRKDMAKLPPAAMRALKGLTKIVLKSGGLALNGPGEGSGQLLSGLPGVTTFLGVPCTRNNMPAGYIAVFNRRGGYGEAERNALAQLAPLVFDVIMYKRREKEARDNGLMMRTIMDSTSDFIFVKDRDSRVVLVNKAYEQTFLSPLHSVIGMNDYQLYSDPKLAEAIIHNDRQVMRSGKPQIFEESAMTPNGYKTYSLSKVPWRGDQGEILGVLGIAHDVTELKKREAELNAIRKDLSCEVAALKMLHQIGVHYIRQENIQHVYDQLLEAAVTFTRADRGVAAVLCEEDGSCAVISQWGFHAPFLSHFEGVIIRQLMDIRRHFDTMFRVVVKSVEDAGELLGETTKALLAAEDISCLQCTPMFGKSGVLVGFLCTGYREKQDFDDRECRLLDLLARQTADVVLRSRMESALKESENQALKLVAELQESDRNKNEFISALSHELRNPLATIMAGLSLMEITGNGEKAMSVTEIIRRQVGQLCTLVDDLLDLTRITRNKILLRKQRMALCEAAQWAADSLQVQFDQKGVALRLTVPPDEIYLDADPVRLKQIMGNLLHNALKFSDVGGTVRLGISLEGDWACLSVTDQGIGMAPEFIPQLFKPFSQADSSFDRGGGGLGLGLSIVKGIAELHGGSVSAYSEGPGKGSQFIIRLPVLKGGEKGKSDDGAQDMMDGRQP